MTPQEVCPILLLYIDELRPVHSFPVPTDALCAVVTGLRTGQRAAWPDRFDERDVDQYRTALCADWRVRSPATTDAPRALTQADEQVLGVARGGEADALPEAEEAGALGVVQAVGLVGESLGEQVAFDVEVARQVAA